MLTLIMACILIFVLSVVMTMAGRGGGNFYVLVLVLLGVSMHQAAATGQFILFTTAMAALFVFQKHRVVIWPLAIFIGVITACAAFVGGYCAHWFSGFSLKLIFSAFLALAGGMMLFPVKERSPATHHKKFGFWSFTSDGTQYRINVWIVLPVTLLTGFGSGMVGVSGGSFLVPLMVLVCGIPIRAAVGTASTMIAATALMGFLGHAAQGDFQMNWAILLALLTLLGGAIGGKLALQTKSAHLKQIFAYTTLAASVFMLTNACYAHFSHQMPSAQETSVHDN